MNKIIYLSIITIVLSFMTITQTAQGLSAQQTEAFSDPGFKETLSGNVFLYCNVVNPDIDIYMSNMDVLYNSDITKMPFHIQGEYACVIDQFNAIFVPWLMENKMK